MKNKTIIILTIAVALALLSTLPLPLNAQHVVTRKSTSRPNKERKSTPKQQQSSSRKTSTQRESNRPLTEAERQKVIDNLVKNMVFVDGGTFTMGATPEQMSVASSDEKPSHEVTMSPFYICKYEVTQREWRAVMGSNPSYFKGDNLPVENVSWDDCLKFIDKLNILTGRSFRLPTEAEWEYAARGGNKSKEYKYPGGNNVDELAWYRGTSGNETHAVGKKLPNELGVYDMGGNVWEWCYDTASDYTSAPQTNPKGPTLGEYHIYRGGAYNYEDSSCRVSRRDRAERSYSNSFIGFRLARSY